LKWKTRFAEKRILREGTGRTSRGGHRGKLAKSVHGRVEQRKRTRGFKKTRDVLEERKKRRFNHRARLLREKGLGPS